MAKRYNWFVYSMQRKSAKRAKIRAVNSSRAAAEKHMAALKRTDPESYPIVLGMAAPKHYGTTSQTIEEFKRSTGIQLYTS